MARSEAPASAKAAGNSYPLCLPPPRQSSTLQQSGRYPYIHVHHLRPLSEIKASYVVDPKEDLRPVCPNCHAVIHLRKPSFTLEEVLAMLAAADDRDAGV